MEILLDTANIEMIKKYEAVLPLTGVTTNPSIVKKEGKVDFFAHMNTIREIIGKERSLHVQVVAKDKAGMLKDVEAILEQIDREVYLKIPASEEGLKVIKILKKEELNVTATAIYTKFQAYLAIAAGADYIAPYFNRMENLNIDAKEAMAAMANEIERSNSKTKIVAASFKNVGQVTTALDQGAQAVTVAPDIIAQALAMPSIAQAVDDFTEDWESIFGKSSTIDSLNV
ncbi:fructose-6-phosphate aldolase [Tetragenococcus koreensis]|uniref:Transaldolase n=1 Tax=Tetragenococcus koreensis TaxID=290335 RepID=A0AAN4RIC7_9ENTE|nr:fructose-6-phosphate aldolase [Tetragenococcus koreensis]MCF1584613.1 fructose-6-phosphate aldolase [Tetragenococcus koreensis]MCF1614165.1 fructose-6-phosphate aldolase [Tetragenococcus koreensis]MCF1619701.1 fructose-6-phosphate aldolase [Tetragenococcus koreensis]MCF1623954.1 fructose-6-phosphate aldolase [Tetragenococcus koreensis]MCF1627895.1 fructose-6-phosphate aldolase [Tetragenococcus koreensis]